MQAYLKYGAGYALEMTMLDTASMMSMLIMLAVVSKFSHVPLNSQRVLEGVLIILILRKILRTASIGVTCLFQFNVLFSRIASILELKTSESENAN